MVAEMVALAARVGDFCVQGAFLKSDQAVHQLEHRSGRVRGLDRPVEHRLVGVLDDLVIVLADVRQHAHIDSRAGHKRQDLSCLWLDRHEAAYLVVHEFLAVLLQVGVDCGVDVVSRDGFLVHLSVLVTLLDLVAGVAQIDVVAFLAAQFLFPRRLDSGLPGVVSGTIFPWMLLDVVGIYLGDVAQQVPSGVDRVVADASGLPPEPWEIVLKLSELHVCLRLYLLEHHHALVADAAAVPGIFSHLPLDEFGRHVQRLRQHQRVEPLHFPRSDKDVIGDFVADDDLSVTVVDDASCRVDDVIDHRVVGRIDLVPVIDYLDVEQLSQNDRGDDQEPDHQGFPSTFCLHRSAG